MDPLKIIADVKAAEAAFASGNVANIVDSCGDLLKDAAGVIRLFSGGVFAAPPLSDVAKAEGKAECDKLAATVAAFKPKVGAGEVTSWGDGSLLSALVAQLPAILSFLSHFFG